MDRAEAAAEAEARAERGRQEAVDREAAATARADDAVGKEREAAARLRLHRGGGEAGRAPAWRKRGTDVHVKPA